MTTQTTGAPTPERASFAGAEPATLDKPVSVSTFWKAHVCLSQAGFTLQSEPFPDYLTTNMQDMTGQAAYDVLPAILAIPARSADEAMMQICALASRATVAACNQDAPNKSECDLWAHALVSIVFALGSAGRLPLFDLPITAFMGRGVHDEMRARVAYLDGLTSAVVTGEPGTDGEGVRS